MKQLNLALLTLSILLTFMDCNAQSLEKYNGPYKWYENEGEAEYSYINNNGKRIFNGDFKFKYEKQVGSNWLACNVTGSFKDGEIQGPWTYTLEGKVKGYALHQKLTGTFDQGIPNGVFLMEFDYAGYNSTTRVSYVHGQFANHFEHINSEEKLSVSAEFSPKGFLHKKLVENKNGETIELYFDENDVVSLFVGLVNGQEVKRVELKETLMKLDPIYVTTDTIPYQAGNEYLEQIWGDGFFGHLNGKGSFDVKKYNKIKYVQYQKLNSLAQAGFTSIDQWNEIDPSVPHSHQINLDNHKEFKYGNKFNTSNSVPYSDVRNKIIKSDIERIDEITKMYKSINSENVSKSYNNALLKLSELNRSIKNQQDKQSELMSIMGDIEKVFTNDFGVTEFPKLAEYEWLKNDLKTHEDRANELKNSIHSDYALTNCEQENTRLQNLITSTTWSLTDTLSTYNAKLKELLKDKITPCQSKSQNISSLMAQSKDAEEISRIAELLKSDSRSNLKTASYNNLISTIDDLIKINVAIEGMLVNSAEKYKPIKKELKNALTAAEIRTLIGL